MMNKSSSCLWSWCKNNCWFSLFSCTTSMSELFCTAFGTLSSLSDLSFRLKLSFSCDLAPYQNRDTTYRSYIQLLLIVSERSIAVSTLCILENPAWGHNHLFSFVVSFFFAPLNVVRNCKAQARPHFWIDLLWFCFVKVFQVLVMARLFCYTLEVWILFDWLREDWRKIKQPWVESKPVGYLGLVELVLLARA